MKRPLKGLVKIGLVVAVIPLLLMGVVYLVLVMRLNDVLAYVVRTETNGQYALRSKDVQLSIWNRTVQLDDLMLTRQDTANAPVYYGVRIPRAYLSITSWQELIRNKRLTIDSLAVVRPEIVVHDYRVRAGAGPNRRGGFQPSMILEGLQKTLDRLHAHAFSIDRGSLVLYRRRGQPPLEIRDVSLSVLNFMKIDTNDRHLFGSDKIELALGRQRWVLADGTNRLSFRGMKFSSATQLVEIDSVSFEKPATAQEGSLRLRAEKFFFNSSHLPALYQKGQLSLDTLVCVRPVLILPIRARSHTPADTAGTLHTSITHLFRTVAVRYVQIKDGRIQIGNPKTRSVAVGTRSANLNVYNLTFNPQQQPTLRTDSIRLNLKNTAFYSEDSLFKIEVGSFTLLNQDVIFENVRYGPARYASSGPGLTFTAPTLRLRNIRLEDLLRKRLVASEAVLFRPAIVVKAFKQPSATPRPDSTGVVKQTKKDLYQTLHGLADLLRVNQFRIVNASATYRLAAAHPVTASMQRLNATILLADLLRSDSLVDIKYAIPALTIGNVNVTTSKLKLTVCRYRFDGKRRHNWVDTLRLTLDNGTRLSAGKLYWAIFDWDVFQRSKLIQIARLRVSTLDVNVKTGAARSAPPVDTVLTLGRFDANRPRKPLPRLRIAQMQIRRLNAAALLPKQARASLSGTDLHVTSLTTDARQFRWAQVIGTLSTIRFNQPTGGQVSVASLLLSSNGTNILTGLRFTSNHPAAPLTILVPKLSLAGPFSSSDFSVINLRSISVEQPELTLLTKSAGTQPVPSGNDNANPFRIPLSLNVGELAVRQARVNYLTKKKQATTSLQTQVDVTGSDLHSTKEEALTFTALTVLPRDIQVTTGTLTVIAPRAGLNLLNGRLTAVNGKPSLAAHLKADWTVADLTPTLSAKNGKTPPEIRVGRVTGDMDVPTFVWMAGQPLDWQSYVDRANVTVSDVRVKTPASVIETSSIAWKPAKRQVQIGAFALRPVQSKEAFLAPPNSQGDYITVKGDQAIINNLRPARWHRDSVLAINHITLTNVDTDVFRDKRRPMPTVIPEKLMPTQLISRIRMPLRIDSVSLVNAAVTYHELSKVTNREGRVPLRNINGTLRNITNQTPRLQDSLTLMASASLMDLSIHRLRYRESYADSLSGFRLLVKTAELPLPGLTPITNAMAAADLDDGFVEPITARLAGNRYASVGTLRFHYRDLKVRLLNHQDTARKTLLLNVENFVVRKVLRRKNAADARIYFARDRQKFVFNYWIKSIVSGVLVSVGVKKDKKYHANYLKMAHKHQLPAEDE